MIDHIGVPATDIARSRAFYEAALAPLGIRTMGTETNGLGNGVVLMGDGEVFLVLADGEPVTIGLHVAFRARTSGVVDAFHRAAIAAGRRDQRSAGPPSALCRAISSRLRARPRRHEHRGGMPSGERR